MKIIWKGPLLSRESDVDFHFMPRSPALRDVLSPEDLDMVESGGWSAWDAVGEPVGLDTILIRDERVITMLPPVVPPERIVTGAFLWSLMAIAALLWFVLGVLPKHGPFEPTARPVGVSK